MPDWLGFLWYEFAYCVCNAFFTLGFSLKTRGRLNIPKTGPVLVIANHQSYLDPVLVGLSTRRHLNFLARKTLFRNPLFGWLIRSLNAVPIDQEGVGKEGLKAILQRLQQGQAVLVFPEGTRTDHGQMNPFKPGIQLLIKQAQPPIVPVGIAGAYDAWPVWRPYPLPAPLFLPPGPGSIAVVVGTPLDGKEVAALNREDMLAELYNRVHEVQQQAERLRRKD